MPTTTARPRGPADNPALYRDCDFDAATARPRPLGPNACHVRPFAVFNVIAKGLARNRDEVAQITGVPRQEVGAILNRKPWERQFQRDADPRDLTEEFL